MCNGETFREPWQRIHTAANFGRRVRGHMCILITETQGCSTFANCKPEKVMSTLLNHHSMAEPVLVGEGSDVILMVTIHFINTAFENLLLFNYYKMDRYRSVSDWMMLKKMLKLCFVCDRQLLLHLAGVQEGLREFLPSDLIVIHVAAKRKGKRLK